MREDLNKLLCERQRRGSWRSFKQVRRNKKFAIRDPENTATREGMTWRHNATSQEKDLNENLRPLEGQVRAAVGRPWDKFYSDLCKVFDKRSVINQHILGHLKDFIELDVYVTAAGVLMQANKYMADSPLSTSTEFYVDPRDGIIKRNRRFGTYRQSAAKRRAAAAIELAAIHRVLPNGDVLHKIDDVWFLFTVEDAPVGQYIYDKPPGRDLFKPSRWSKAQPWERLRDYEKRSVGMQRFVGQRVPDLLTGESVFSEPGKPPVKYHASKRTASHKILKQAGLVP